MGPLNYLGALPKPGNSMPAGIPGVGGLQDPTATAAGVSSAQALPALNFGGPPMGMAPPPMSTGPDPAAVAGPEGQQYTAVTQIDGTVLLHLANPDGSLGPAVKIIPAIGGRKSA